MIGMCVTQAQSQQSLKMKYLLLLYIIASVQSILMSSIHSLFVLYWVRSYFYLILYIFIYITF